MSWGIPRKSDPECALRNPASSLMLVTDLFLTVDPYYSWILYLEATYSLKFVTPKSNHSCMCRLAEGKKKKFEVRAEVKQGQTALFLLSYCKQVSPSQTVIALFFFFFFAFLCFLLVTSPFKMVPEWITWLSI